MLMISLVLHGVVLMLPMPSDKEKPKPEQVKITQLPTTRPSAKPLPQSSSKPNPQPNPQPSQLTRTNEPTRPTSSSQLNLLPSLQPSQSTRTNEPTRPTSSSQLNPLPSFQPSQSTRTNEPTRPTSSSQLNPLPSLQPSQSTRPRANQPLANPIISQAQPKPSSQPETSQPQEATESSKSKSSQSQPSNPAPNADADDTEVKDPLKDFLSNFPFPENANAGSLGVLSKDADESARNVKQPLGQVIKYYGKELPDRKYTPLASPIADDTDLKIYQVSKGSVSQYLHLISKGEDTVIFLSGKKLAREELANLEVETAEEREFKDTIRQSVAVTSPKELTSDIKKKLADGKYNNFGIFPGKTPAQLGSEFSSALSGKGFVVGSKPIDLGADGLIYSISKNSFNGFIQLIPAEDGSGTAIISLDDFSY